MNKRSRKTMWSLPSVDEWLAELHGLSPPQLSMPVAGSAVRKRAPPPLFGLPGEIAPAAAARPLPILPAPVAAARPLPRLPADEGAEAQVTANPLGVAREQEDEWEEQRSEEHGDRVYWVNKRTGQSQWDRPGDWM